MNQIIDPNQKSNWYVSHEILAIELDDEDTDDVLVWENLILINADDPSEAYEKAMQHGVASEDEIKVNGKKGRLSFKGLKDLVLIYEELEDGAEIEWHEIRISKSELNGWVKTKPEMHAFNPRRTDDDNS